MAIVGVCPDCAYKAPLQSFLQDARGRAAMKACLQISPHLADRIMNYLDLFSPGTRAIRHDKLANLFEELAKHITSAQVERNGQVWSAPVPVWKTALEAVVANRDNLTLPLPNHGYLFTTIANLANKAAGQREDKKHQQAQQGAGDRQGKKSMKELSENRAEKAKDFKANAKQLLKGGGNSEA